MTKSGQVRVIGQVASSTGPPPETQSYEQPQEGNGVFGKEGKTGSQPAAKTKRELVRFLKPPKPSVYAIAYPGPHSFRSALIGEMAAARLAGMIAAKKEQIVKAPTATVNAGQSHQETPYS